VTPVALASPPVPANRSFAISPQLIGLVAITGAAFIALFYLQLIGLARDWWNLPEAGHGLLLVPVAIWLAWKAGRHPGAAPRIGWGVAILAAAVLLRYAAGLAAELFLMRASMIGALVGLTVFYAGFRQVAHWWLPFVLTTLAIPLPELITQALALPLQFKASQMGAALLEMRNVPVRLSGNVIRLPGQELFVTEACSGLRSLTALTSTAVLTGALLLKTPAMRIVLLVMAIPIAIVVNGVRVFLTGFLVHFVSPAMGTGFMHATEGWLLFLVSLLALAGFAAVGMQAERWYLRRKHG
jgi:exosortase